MLFALGIVTCSQLYEQRDILYHLYSPSSFEHFMQITLGIGSTRVERFILFRLLFSKYCYVHRYWHDFSSWLVFLIQRVLMYYRSETDGRCCIVAGRRFMFTHQAAAFFCMKWHHGRFLNAQLNFTIMSFVASANSVTQTPSFVALASRWLLHWCFYSTSSNVPATAVVCVACVKCVITSVAKFSNNLYMCLSS